jgi:hypothetical protein
MILNGHIALLAKELAARLNAPEIQAIFKFLNCKSLRVHSDEICANLTLPFEQLCDTFQTKEIQCSGQDSTNSYHRPALWTRRLVSYCMSCTTILRRRGVQGCSKAVLESILTVYRSIGQEGILRLPTLWYGLASSRYLERSGLSAKDVVEGSTRVSQQLSQDVLILIPCPLLMIAGSCAWENYSAAIKHKSRTISFEAAAGV